MLSRAFIESLSDVSAYTKNAYLLHIVWAYLYELCIQASFDSHLQGLQSILALFKENKRDIH